MPWAWARRSSRVAVRAIIAAAINNFAHGLFRRSAGGGRAAARAAGARLPAGSAGRRIGGIPHAYGAHRAGADRAGDGAVAAADCVSGAEALQSMQLAPLVLGAKEGLSLVNGTPCATGLSALALGRTQRLLDWADMAAAMTFENLHGQVAVFDADALGLRVSAGVRSVGERLRALLSGSAILRAERRPANPGPLEPARRPAGARRRPRSVRASGAASWTMSWRR